MSASSRVFLIFFTAITLDANASDGAPSVTLKFSGVFGNLVTLIKNSIQTTYLVMLLIALVLVLVGFLIIAFPNPQLWGRRFGGVVIVIGLLFASPIGCSNMASQTLLKENNVIFDRLNLFFNHEEFDSDYITPNQ